MYASDPPALCIIAVSLARARRFQFVDERDSWPTALSCGTSGCTAEVREICGARSHSPEHVVSRTNSIDADTTG